MESTKIKIKYSVCSLANIRYVYLRIFDEFTCENSVRSLANIRYVYLRIFSTFTCKYSVSLLANILEFTFEHLVRSHANIRYVHSPASWEVRISTAVCTAFRKEQKFCGFCCSSLLMLFWLSCDISVPPWSRWNS
jgi:hypothetical protein